MEYQVFVEERILKNELYYKDQLILTYEIRYPQFVSSEFTESIYKLNTEIDIRARFYEQYISSRLYQFAIEEYEDSITYGYRMRVFDFNTNYVITYNQDCVISLYFDQYEYTGGVLGRTVRFSISWDLQKNKRMVLSDMFTTEIISRDFILNEIRKQIEHQVRDIENLNFTYYYILIYDKFNDINFYITPEGVVVYFQEYDIAPFASGALSYLIPYSGGVVIHPSCE